MKELCVRAAVAVMILGWGTAPLHAQSSDAAFLQCMQDCQDWQPNAQIVHQCENWCYVRYQPN